MTVCFTGHRPSKLPGGYYYYSLANIELGKILRIKILELINNGATHFICGGALGVDQMAFMVLKKLKSKGYNINIEIAIPFEYQYTKWNDEQKKIHFESIRFADKVTYVDTLPQYNTSMQPKIYDVKKLDLRNRYMVDNSDVVIAVWDGSKSGTQKCIDYAIKNKKKLIIIDNIFN